jgi:uncharacterized membrane protein
MLVEFQGKKRGLMGNFQIDFQYPWMLVLLILIPIAWWIGVRSLAGLGPVRRGLALVLRSLVLLLVIAALAGVQWIWTSERQTVIYLLDQSDSIPLAKRQLMLRYAVESVKKFRRTSNNRNDRAGLIIFGREASIEIPPLDENLPPLSQPESYLGKTDATNIEGALKLAAASFLEDSAKRIVILTDGNQTLGSAETTAKRLAESGIGIDVIPVRLDSSTEVLVEKIDVPGFVRQGQTVEARVVINRYQEAGTEAKEIEGRLRVLRRIGNQIETLVDAPYTLDRDINVVPIPHRIDETAGYTYEAEFITKEREADTIAQNNRATAFTYARGRGRVMLIEDANNPGNYDSMVDALRRNDIDVDVRNTANLFSSLVELQTYDSVVLAGVPRASGENASQIISITDDQIEMLVQSVQQFGMGLLMLGGPEAFGAGGWTNTKLESAMPVDFAIKNTKVEAVGALAMVMHASEMSEGNYWQKMVGKAALNALGPQDYCGVVQYDMQNDKWLWGTQSQGLIKVGENRAMMKSRISRMVPGDMPDFDSSLKLAISSLKKVNASVKHMIIISDGDPTAASNGVLNDFSNNKIKISTVAVGAHGVVGTAELKRIANRTGGNYYEVTNAGTLPKIFMREAQRVSRPLVYEPEGGVMPVTQLPGHEVMSGLTGQLPRIRGFVLTERKDSPLVEVPLLSPKPTEPETASLLATWTYGLGRTAVFTTDAGKRWATDWVGSPYYDQFFSQMVRWTMRPSGDEGKFNIATNAKEGRVQIVVNAMDANDQFLNFLDMNATAIGPDLKPITVPLRQQAPGRYIGEFTPEQSGSFMVSVNPGAGKPTITTGVTVPFSDEYRVRQANFRLLEQIATQTPQGGESGKVFPTLDMDALDKVLEIDTYRSGVPPAKSLQDIWPYAVLLGASLFFADVFVRRVALDLGVPLRWIAQRLRRSPATDSDIKRQQSLDRLRSRKSNVSDELDRQRASVSLESPPASESEPSATAPSAADAFGKQDSAPREPSKPSPQASGMSPGEDEKSYTSRLLEAKRQAKKKQN